HPHREGLDLVERDVRVVADAALRRAARDVVRDAVAVERPYRAVVHLNRDRDGHGLLHCERTLTRFESMLKVRATRRNCSRAISKGFPRRWAPVSPAVTFAP